MAKLQLIFLVETSEDDKADNIYIRSVIDKYFLFLNDKYDGEVNILTYCLKGKQHYNDKKTIDYINNKTRMFASYNEGAVTAAIYFMDTDSVETEYKKGSFFSNVQEFCKEHGFELVWFCKNVENVFLNKEVDQVDNKTESAKEFAINNKIRSIKQANLSKNMIEYGCSNIILVLGKYLKNK